MPGILDDTNFVFTDAAWMMLAANGSLSAVSSILIMSIILRSSPESRTSAFHIIMFSMSFWDTITSIAMALNTIPMPSDVREIYPFAGKTYGNIGTCEAQAFLIWMGLIFVLGSITTLNVYYVCTLRFGITEEKFKMRILPVMAVLSMTISIMMPTISLRMDLFNPSPFRNFCISNPYPYDCASYHNNSVDEREGSDIECIRGDKDVAMSDFLVLWLIMIGGTFLVLVSSLILVIVTVFDAELAIRRSRRIQRAPGVSDNLQEIDEFKRTRAVSVQALMYIGVFFLTYAGAIILMVRMPTYSLERGPSNFLAFINVFFLPLQGFFNAMIFVYQKICRLRQTNAALNFFQAFQQVILSPSTIPQELISGVEMVDLDVGLRRRGDHQIQPGQLTAEQRQQIVRNSGMRRFANGEDNTPPPSMSSAVGSSSLGQFSSGIPFEDLIGPDGVENTSRLSGRRLRTTSVNSWNGDGTPPTSVMSEVGLSSYGFSDPTSSSGDTSVDESKTEEEASRRRHNSQVLLSQELSSLTSTGDTTAL